MKSDIEKFTKIMSITAELYEMNPKYFIDCFFDMYFQMKKKNAIDERCNYDEDTIKRTWNALKRFQWLVKEKKEHPDKAFVVAYKSFKVDPELMKGLINTFNAIKSAKKTKFKGLY